MFEQLLGFVREASQEAVVQNPAVPDEHNEAVIQEAATTVQTGIQDIYQQQGAAGIKQLFQSADQGNTNSPQVQQLSGNFVDNLTSRLGISKGMAGGLAAMLIPMLLRKMMHHNSQGNTGSGFNMGNILGSILGGGALGGMFGGNSSQPQTGGGGMMSQIGASLGLDRDGDGDTDLNDLMSMFGKR